MSYCISGSSLSRIVLYIFTQDMNNLQPFEWLSNNKCNSIELRIVIVDRNTYSYITFPVKIKESY